MHAEQRPSLGPRGLATEDKIALYSRLVNRFQGASASREPGGRARAECEILPRSLRGAERATRCCVDLLNSRGGTRTPDPVINSHLLYQLSYSGSSMACSRQGDSAVGRAKLAVRLRLGNEASAVHRINPGTPSSGRICGSPRGPDARSTGQLGSAEYAVSLPPSHWLCFLSTGITAGGRSNYQ